MRALLIEAVPAVPLRLLAEALVEHLPVVVEHIVLAGNVEDFLGLETLERLRQRVELFRLRQLRQIAGVQHECRRCGQRVHLGNRRAQRRGNVRVCVLVESDVAVADLHEAQVACHIADLALHDVAQSERLQHAPLQYA